jgi:hypothetical protein
MIVSVSRRTDIPAFYSEWFMNRVRAGFALVPNPFFPEKASRVDLCPEAVDALVFITRNPGPLLPHLDELESRGCRFCFQITITGYPRILEPRVIAADEAVRLFRKLSDRIGPAKMTWRFDPIVLSTPTSEDFIVESFRALAGNLRGATGRVIVSFVDYYKKVSTAFRKLEREAGISFFDARRDPETLYRVAARIAAAAHDHAMEIFSCAERHDFASVGIQRGKCIDAEYLGRIFGRTIRAPKAGNQRKDCGCDDSRDIGAYGTCLHGCIYCYAGGSRRPAAGAAPRYDPQNPCLTGGAAGCAGETNQPSLF